ncbi:adhesion G-protein coupled receptor D1-like [Asterias rubens]|uniref:adhesion G-protein coupled receptor D1-like n=1 Tax=Asterias rubens TaxID=7604 RepID=UPI0014556DBE|nr:adhesion G-protein coupled receptor D1-like [Asterias rubens]
MEPDADYQLTVGSITDSSKLLIVGDTSSSQSAKLYVYNLAVWESHVPHQMINQLIGMSKYEFHCLSSADVCWSFEYPKRIRPRYQLSPTGVSFIRDRHHQGRGVCLNGVRSGISLFGISATRCPADPSACANGLVVGMWLKLTRVTSSRNSGYLLSVGATDPGERGVSLFQSITGIHVKVVEARIMWQTDIKSSWLTFDRWMYLGIVWSGQEQYLTVSIDGKKMPTLLSHTKGKYRAHDVSSLTLGKSSQSDSDFLTACYDDVTILSPKVGDHLPSPNTLTGEPDFEPYLSADEHFDVNDPDGSVKGEHYSATKNRFDVENSSVDTGVPGSPLGYINLGDFAGRCVSDPSLCSDAGLSISVWIKVDNMDHFADPLVNPGGVGYILSSGAQSANGTGLSAFYSRDKFLYVQVLDGQRKWFSKFEYELGRDWLNFGTSWSREKGLLVILDGHVKGNDPVGEPLVRTMDSFTTLILGKRNDRNTSYLGGAFDDPAIWYQALDKDDPNLEDIIMGKYIDDIVETVNYDDLDDESPDRAQPSCKIIHEADCAKTMQQLLDVIKGEIILSADAAESSTNSLMRFTSEGSTLSSSELDLAVSVIDKLSKRQLATTLDDVTAEAILEDFLEVTSNLLDPVFTKKWVALHKTKAGVTSLMESVETFAADVAGRLVWNSQVLLNTSHILMTMDVVSEDYFISEVEAIFPRHGQRWETLEDKWRNMDDYVTIPKEVFHSEINKNFAFDGSLVFTWYDSLNKMAPVVSTNNFVLMGGKSLSINSNIMSVMIEPKIQHKLTKPILVTLNHHKLVTKSKPETPVCAFWNFDVLHTINGAWDREGCEVQSTSQTQTQCLCYHMTHFAIVMEPLQEPVYDEHAVVLRWLVRCLVGVSVFCLVVLIVTYVVSKRLHTLRHSIHLNLCLACLLASVSFAMSEFTSNSQVLCLVNGATMQCFYLAVILWLTMESFQLYSDTAAGGIKTNDATEGFAVWRNRMGFYMIGGWVIPAVTVGSVLGVSLNVYKPQRYVL